MKHNENSKTTIATTAVKSREPQLKKRFNIDGIKKLSLPKILMVATYPPRECGIATYTYDLKKALDKKFERCFDVKICALESDNEKHIYKGDEVYIRLNTSSVASFEAVANEINADNEMEIVMIQHEFGLFVNNQEAFVRFLKTITKPIIIAFHTVLPNPNKDLEAHVKELASLATTITVMTNSSYELLIHTYGVQPDKVKVISHGTHLVKHQEKSILKKKYEVQDRKVISTFGFLGPGKSIETTLDALPEIVKVHPDILFLIVGKTHPTLYNQEGDAYMNSLQQKVKELNIENQVRFVNKFVPLPELLEYLQLSDCYIFTSKDPNQAVSGTFSYAVSCGCPIISTPIPHAREVLSQGNGLLFDFGDSNKLAANVNNLLNDENLKYEMKMKGLHASASTSWENAALLHAITFSEQTKKRINLRYRKPPVDMSHIKEMTTDIGIIQFSKINTPDLDSGYTLDDNARALITACDYYKTTEDPSDLKLVRTYANFILKCQRDNGLFLNYVDKNQKFTKQNEEVNLEDSNGRGIWALGYAYSVMEEGRDLDITLLQNIKEAVHHFTANFVHFNSPRALSFAIKGLYFLNLKLESQNLVNIIEDAANKLVDLYDANYENEWKWFEPYLTYANSVLPEALLYAWKATAEPRFQRIAKDSFDFLLTKIFDDDAIRVISNKKWFMKGVDVKSTRLGGEQPIDVAYTILALKQFDTVFPKEGYDDKMEIAFSWFLGNNQLKQIIYNPCTGGCHDGLEDYNVNLNQGSESTVSYYLARFAF
ncbi:glycosyltransferase [Flavobacterium algicola]|uniref:glycosyltransferase n=1 Tax=Flavobacterium algicola TaxID=556529 RepID=UPI001EFE27A3|nr:glycosyltransferase [Flavobacterium algicola]MCG9791181.1 glycosyltransferase [Flavobacterium algicola]